MDETPILYSSAQKEGRGLSLLGSLVRQNNQNSQNEPGMSFGINQIVNRGAEEGAWPLKNKGLLTMLPPYCESEARIKSGRPHTLCTIEPRLGPCPQCV